MKNVKETKPVEGIVALTRPLSCEELIDLLGSAIGEYNYILEEEWKKLPFLKRLFGKPNVYVIYPHNRIFYSIDGMKEEKPLIRSDGLDPEFYPDAKYETRCMLSIWGTGKGLYFNVIPGIATRDQFTTWILESETIPCITIKSNLKSKSSWKEKQVKFLRDIIPLIERIDKRIEAAE